MAKKWIFFIPLGLFVIIALYFFWQLQFGRDPSLVPSAMIDEPAPRLDYPALDENLSSGLSAMDLIGDKKQMAPIRIVNFFASWCVPCRAEHPFLIDLAKRNDVSLIGIAYKDKPPATLAFLRELGNPYDYVVTDDEGRAGIEWGLYGVPETYIVDNKGIIWYKHTGPMVGEGAVTPFMEALSNLKEGLEKN